MFFAGRVFLIHLALAGFVISLVACGGSGNGGGGGGMSPQDTTVTFNVPIFFLGGLPQTPGVQVQVGSGAFMPVPVQNKQVSFTVPAGTTKYQIAYTCESGGEGAPINNLAILIQATTQDSTTVSGNCFGDFSFASESNTTPATGSATGMVDATAIPGAVNIELIGIGGAGTGVSSNQGPFNFSLPVGTNDVAIIATNSTFTHPPLALKILQEQIVPGALNGGNTIVLGTANEMVQQPLTVGNVPAGTVTTPAVAFHTANGLLFPVQNGGPATQYPDVPPGTVQTGDTYVYEAIAQPAASANSGGPPTAAMLQTTSTGGGPVNITLPNAWVSSNPTSIGSPTTITFDYPGFAGIPVTAEEAEVTWINVFPSFSDIKVFATANFQNGANTITFPNPNGSGPVFGCCSSGLSVSFRAANFRGHGAHRLIS